jgi:hypothetical protein
MEAVLYNVVHIEWILWQYGSIVGCFKVFNFLEVTKW